MVVLFPAVPQQNQMQNAPAAVQQQVFIWACHDLGDAFCGFV